jgi:hypothetical protein
LKKECITSIQSTDSITELLTVVLAKQTERSISKRGAVELLNGTVITMTDDAKRRKSGQSAYGRWHAD